jgi:hypothetical protein
MIPYTQCNLIAIFIWHMTGKSSYFASILWCNSIAIQISYDFGRYVNYTTFIRFSSKIPLHLDKFAHIAPFIILYPIKENWQITHSLFSLSCHLLWGSINLFDLNQLYSLNPKLMKKEITLLWLAAGFGHFVAGTERLLY